MHRAAIVRIPTYGAPKAKVMLESPAPRAHNPDKKLIIIQSEQTEALGPDNEDERSLEF